MYIRFWLYINIS